MTYHSDKKIQRDQNICCYDSMFCRMIMTMFTDINELKTIFVHNHSVPVAQRL